MNYFILICISHLNKEMKTVDQKDRPDIKKHTLLDYNLATKINWKKLSISFKMNFVQNPFYSFIITFTISIVCSVSDTLDI